MNENLKSGYHPSVSDIAIMLAKIATFKNERARMVVNGVSVLYSITKIARLRNMLLELDDMLSCITFQTRINGGYSAEQESLRINCQEEIKYCNQQIAKYGIMACVDAISAGCGLYKSLTRR